MGGSVPFHRKARGGIDDASPQLDAAAKAVVEALDGPQRNTALCRQVVQLLAQGRPVSPLHLAGALHRTAVHECVQTLTFSAITVLVLAGAFSYTVLQASTGHLQIGDIALYLGAVGQAQDRVMGLGNWSGHLSRLQLHLRSLFDFLDGARPAIALPSEGQGAPAPARFKDFVGE